MLRNMSLLIAMLTLMSFALSEDTTSSGGATTIGRRITNFELYDHRGRLRSLDDFADSRLLVVAFLGTECPLAKLYGLRLSELSTSLKSSGVQFLAINSNCQDSLSEIAAYARIHKIPFPILKDPDNAVADLFSAVRTPEVFLLDQNRRVRYWGRIDDQYSIGVQLDKPRRHDLKIAIEEVIAGEEVLTPITNSVGCHIGRKPKIVPHGDVTYSNQIARILRRHCISCHREGQIAPFPLTNYREVLGWAAMIQEVVDEGRMPPWFANPKHGEFQNDARMTDEDKSLITKWIENGCPEGDAELAAELPAIESNWRIPQPDEVYYISDEPYNVPADGEVEYQYFMIDPGFDEDQYIQAVEVRPDNPSVVHHALVSIARPNDETLGLANCGVLINFAPGMQPTHLPSGMAIYLPAGSRFLVQMHYTPNGTPQEDRTSIGIVFAEPASVDKHVYGGAIVNTNIQIPAGASKHLETAEHEFDDDVTLLSLSPHMHLRGKAFRYEAIYPNGSREILLDVPRYDFNWQLRYILKQPKRLPRGTRLVCWAWYDNSTRNLANPDPEATVQWGDQTWEEMLIGFYSVLWN